MLALPTGGRYSAPDGYFEEARTTSADDVLLQLREFGLACPQGHTKSPWPGHLDLAVRDKTIVHLSIEGEPFSISCKLVTSWPKALKLPFARPTAYGLGKSSWVTATFADDAKIPMQMLQDWIDKSYRAQAPQKTVATLPTK